VGPRAGAENEIDAQIGLGSTSCISCGICSFLDHQSSQDLGAPLA